VILLQEKFIKKPNTFCMNENESHPTSFFLSTEIGSFFSLFGAPDVIFVLECSNLTSLFPRRYLKNLSFGREMGSFD